MQQSGPLCYESGLLCYEAIPALHKFQSMDPASHHLELTGKRKQVKRIRIRLIVSIILLLLVSSLLVIILLY